MKACIGFVFLALTGCWDKAELTEYGFVQAAAIHHNAKGKLELTTLFYKPSGGSEQGPSLQPKGPTPLVIRTEADTLFEAIRDIPIHLGRKAKWDHMRVILISEDSAKRQDIGDTLDYFSRDHEPRETIFVMIGKGDPGQYLEMKPFIENTIGQQLRKMAEAGADYASKTMTTNLLDVAMQLKSATKVTNIPYVYKSERVPNTPAVSGLAILRNGILVDHIASTEVQFLIMATNHYRSGIIEFPCPNPDPDKQTMKESFEVITLKSAMTSKVRDGIVSTRIQIQIEGDAGELSCSKLKTEADFKAFDERIEHEVIKEVKKMTNRLQDKKLDAIGIGNQIHRKFPKLWEEWKDDWAEHFASATIDCEVEVNDRNAGNKMGDPFSKKPE